MGLLYSLYNVKPLNEVEMDGQSSEAEDNEHSTDYSAQGDEDSAPAVENPTDDMQNQNDDASNNAGEEETPADDGEVNEGIENPEDDSTDYSAMGDDTEAGGIDNANDSEGAATTTNDGSQTPVDELKRQEEEMYADLTPEQLDIKHRELKNQYLAMFDLTTQIIERINDAATTEENMPIVEFVSEKLSSLRDMITDYINSVYKTKSYIENSINYNKFLAILNGINKILEEMNKKEVK